MTADRWERVQILFERALATSPRDRAAFLRASCEGDDAIVDEVAALLEVHEESGKIAALPTTWLRALAGSEPPRFTPGDLVADRYEIRGLIGRGGMGEVYEAWDTGLSIDVALKVLRVAAETESSYRRLRTEGLLARSVWHPNVCRVFDLARHEDPRGSAWFLTMERLGGDTLAARLRLGRMPPHVTRELAAQMASALDAAHAAGVVHRDFKPGNVMLVDRDGKERAVVTDFGIARFATNAEGSESDGTLWGTPAYIAPEQLRGEPGGHAADLYAFGVVLYEMVTGTLPFGSTLETARRKLDERPRPPRDIVPGLDEAWSQAILRCLEREPRHRFQSAAEAVAGWTHGEPTPIHDAPTRSRTPGAGLPSERDVFLGRADELKTVEASLSGGLRLLTLVGTAGMGKTRLATRYGRTRGAAWPGGVWFCDLKGSRDVTGIASAVARAMEVPLGRLDPVRQAGQAIAGRGRCLVILDNFDPVVEHAAATVGRWLETTREASFLATSRERLRLDGELVVAIESLPEEEGLSLFIARARWLCPGLRIRAAEEQSVREIVRLLDGMPLAIELAAARTRVMEIPQIRDLTRDRFRLLTGGSTTRHETLEIAIDASWESLTAWEQAAWAQCSVFEDGFTLEAAEHVLALGEWPEAPPVVDVLSALVERSLLRMEGASGAGEIRFGMYVSLRDYARHRLERSYDSSLGSTQVEARHGAWYSRLGTDEALDAIDRAGGVERRWILDREISNLLAACRRARSRRDPSVAVATYRSIVEVLSLRGPFGPAMELGSSLLQDLALESRQRVQVLHALSRMERAAGMKEDARGHAREAHALANELPDRGLKALLTGWMGNLEYDEGETERARALYEEALAEHMEMANDGLCGLVLSHLGILDYMQGRYESAAARYGSARELLRRAGDRRREAYVCGYLGTLHRNQGRFDRALEEHSMALTVHREVGDRSYECQTTGNLGNLYVEMRRFDEARDCYESAVAMAREMGDRRNEGLFLSNLGSLHLQEGRLTEAESCFERALAHHREVGTRTQEGYAQGLLARLFHRTGRLTEARRELDSAEAILREVRFDLGVAQLLCLRGRLELDSSSLTAARAALEEVEALASERGWESRGELSEMIAELRNAVREAT
ncbi:MAG TPA: tetratricopeptide repeat protein [Candidatus Eisenbacteria bacterium]|nr:tetratricopeptide repeat protein [Candidatus Eisenbacteria bacterium]